MLKKTVKFGCALGVWVSLLLLLLAASPVRVAGIMPTGAIDVSLRDGSSYTLLASQAGFGNWPAEGASRNEAHRLMIPPTNNPLLCKNVTVRAEQGRASFAGGTILVPRGTCSFQFKALIAQELGAESIIVYGNLASRYTLNETKYINKTNPEYTEDDIVYPAEFNDYDCSKGSAQVPASALQLKPLPYNSQHNDPALSGDSDSNICKINSHDGLDQCQSKACLLTGKKNGSNFQACCAWDLHIWLGGDYTMINATQVTIPAVYLTMEEARQILQDFHADEQVFVTIYSRQHPSYNISSVLIWMLGVFVCGLASFMSADDYHRMIRKVLRKQERKKMKSGQSDISYTSASSSTTTSAARVRSSSPPARIGEAELSPAETADAQQHSSPPVHYEESLELNMWHAFGFVVMASSGLLILFFFKIYRTIKVFYAIGCSKAVSQSIFFPLCWRVARRCGYRDRIVWRTGTEDFGDISLLDIISHFLGFSLGMVWIIICFTVRHPEDNLFFWVMQDVFGAAMCISFLSVIKLNSLKVAAILLIVAFFYDIFFVFISPLFFGGKSVMITVATSGGPPTADPLWCEKYPDSNGCQGGEPLPMLFQIPRIGDYQGGSSLLGLGDIVLPGLLVSFAARLDAAKSLLGLIGGGNGALNSYGCPEQRIGSGCRVCSGGYFVPTLIAYAVGLLMANMAVYLMEMGQPALLYLVPCCLGTISLIAWRRNEVHSLWEGPKAIRTVDNMLYGTYESGSKSPHNPNNQHVPVPQEDGQDALAVPSAQDTDGDQERNLV